MALTKPQVREILAVAGVEADLKEDAVKKIMEGHLTSLESLREEIATLKTEVANYKQDTEKLPAVQKELDELKEKVAAEAKEREGKDYDKLQKEFEDYKAEVEGKAVRAGKEAAFKEILKDAGVPEKHYAKIIKYSDIDGIELDDKGKAKNSKDLLKSIKEEWSDHIETETAKGAETETPPVGNGKGGRTKEEILAIKDTNQRQQAIAENPEVFGIS